MINAVILAAGQGTRLRPLTNSRPKTLVPLKGKTLLEWQLQALKKENVNEIAVVTGYLSDSIADLGIKTYKNEFYQTTNMVESLFSAIEFMAETKGDLIVTYGDIVYQTENLDAVIAADDADISVMIDLGWRKLWDLRLEDPLKDAETLHLDEEGFITELGKKPKNYEDIMGQYTGLFKISHEKIQELIDFYHTLDRNKLYDGQDFKNMYMTSFIQQLIDTGWKVKAVPVKHGWLEVDTVEDITLFESLSDKGELDALCRLECELRD